MLFSARKNCAGTYLVVTHITPVREWFLVL